MTSSVNLVRRLSELGIALSAEKDDDRLMELLLVGAMDLTCSDGGTLYLRAGDELRFAIRMTRSLDVHDGGTSGRRVDLPSVPLFDEAGRPNEHMVAARAAVHGETVNIPDAYAEHEFDLSGTHAFDARTGYRSVSFLTVPMRDHEDQVIGVLQLLNRQDGEGGIVPFGSEDQLVAESLASQTAIALTKKRLIDGQRLLFESFIRLIAETVDEKSPHTGGHCRRVPELTLLIADAAAATRDGPLADFTMSEADRYELMIAAWLHDCGKLTTPEHVVHKSTKLETVFDRIELVRARFEILRRDADASLLPVLDEEQAFLEHCNLGGESMSPSDQERVRTIARRAFTDAKGASRTLLEGDEVENLIVPRGTLTPAEREVINHHIVATTHMLEALPYPRHLQRVPEFAGGHHERMDGGGYPRGLKREEMSIQARIMGIADVFEALTARDRPYKEPTPVTEALKILERMRQDGHIDPDLFDLFVRERIYLAYAERFLEPGQVDVTSRRP